MNIGNEKVLDYYIFLTTDILIKLYTPIILYETTRKNVFVFYKLKIKINKYHKLLMWLNRIVFIVNSLSLLFLFFIFIYRIEPYYHKSCLKKYNKYILFRVTKTLLFLAKKTKSWCVNSCCTNYWSIAFHKHNMVNMSHEEFSKDEAVGLALKICIMIDDLHACTIYDTLNVCYNNLGNGYQ